MVKKAKIISKKVLKIMKIAAIVLVAIFIIVAVLNIVNERVRKHIQADVAEMEYNGDISIELNDNKPTFTNSELKNAQKSYEIYSKLDSLGRCGVAEASISTDTMPEAGEKRTSLGSIDPSGWQSINFWVIQN